MRGVASLAGLLLLAACGGSRSERPEPALARLGLRASTGAAAGYVADSGCRTCHASLYDSFQHVGMAQALRRPAEARPIEAFGREFFHAPSQRYYAIRREGDRLVFRRHQLDTEGQPINVFEIEIDWVLGSGNRARSYLFQTAWGELYEVPLGWYSESGSWDMSPGFESHDHPGLGRRVQRQCLFCHNAYPEVASGTDVAWRPHRFPAELPQGIGCQRCHGPGAAHIQAALESAETETITGHIVNPRKLPAAERDSVCFQCHMLPAVAVIGLRRFDRTDYSFRPGERLSDYLVHVEIDEEGVAREDRFEINHHGYRLWQSTCFQESAGQLTCISCHDPHRKPASAEFRARVATVCRDCHGDWSAHEPATPAAAAGCVTCHMPTRRTRDVILVTMTDHRIARGPFDPAALVAPLARSEPVITGLHLLPFGQPPRGDTGELYRLAAGLKAYPATGLVEATGASLARSAPAQPQPHLLLLEAQLKRQQFAEAERTARSLLALHPELPQAIGWLGIALVGQGRHAEAIETLRRALALEPAPEMHYNLALAAFGTGRHELAAQQLDAALELRPQFPEAWKYRGRVEVERGNLEAARAALVRSLEIDPSHTASYTDLVKLLRRLGQHREAERYLEVGRRTVADPAKLRPLAAD